MLVARLAARRDGVLSLDELLACGLSRNSIGVRVRRGFLHRIDRGVYAVGHMALTLRGRFRAAVLAGGETAVLSHFASAADSGFIAWDYRRLPEVTAVGTGRTRPGLIIHRARSLDPRDVTRRGGIPITTPARALLEVAGSLDDRRLRRAVREVQALKLATVDQIADVLSRANGHRGAGRIAAIIATGPAPTRSINEDLVLDLVLDAGLEHPRVNPRRSVDGRRVFPDLQWPEQRLIVEVDSKTWHGNKLAREDDAERQARLEAAGERVVRVTWEQATLHPQQTLDRIIAAGAPLTAAAQAKTTKRREPAARRSVRVERA